jgi:hypothetical protein
MNSERLQEILDAYGADSGRWPEAERAGALALLAQSGEARLHRDQAKRLDALLDDAAGQIELGLSAEGIAAGVRAATHNVRKFPKRNPRPSFGWPGFAGLAAAALAGFVVGWLGLAGDFYVIGTGAQASDQSPGAALTEVEPW